MISATQKLQELLTDHGLVLSIVSEAFRTENGGYVIIPKFNVTYSQPVVDQGEAA